LQGLRRREFSVQAIKDNWFTYDMEPIIKHFIDDGAYSEVATLTYDLFDFDDLLKFGRKHGQTEAIEYLILFILKKTTTAADSN
jgi:hypothetical protein